MKKKILGLIELFLLIILSLTIFLTMPFMLEAMDKDAIVAINYISTICFFFYAMYKVRNIKKGRKGK